MFTAINDYFKKSEIFETNSGKGRRFISKTSFLYENSQLLNRVSFENTIIKFKDNLNAFLNEEIDVYNISTKDLKNKINQVYNQNWKLKIIYINEGRLL